MSQERGFSGEADTYMHTCKGAEVPKVCTCRYSLHAEHSIEEKGNQRNKGQMSLERRAVV